MPGSLLYLCRFPLKSGVTSVCKQSHVFQNFNRGRLLSSKGNNSSFIQKQFIRGAPRNKGDPPQQFVRGAPRHKTDAQQHLQSPGSVLTKHFLMSATIVSGSFIGAIIVSYERSAQGTRRYQDYKVRIAAFQFHFSKMFLYIFVTNAVVFTLWRIPRLLPFMQRYFLASPCKEQSVLGGFLSSFSHENFLHFFVNMYVLWSFSNALTARFTHENILAVYFSGAAVSSFLSIAVKVFRRIPTPSLGASGAICTMIGLVGCAFPDSEFCIALIGEIIPHSFSAKSGILALLTFDSLGVILGWRFFDHAAHLGGTLFGMWYWKYGHNLVKGQSRRVVDNWIRLKKFIS
uniref:rhomboid protease n=1 Tax=Crassostrea virginica TaxID=6565 RepID=A0A8B8EV83_CRAVI|nr:presenilins-associated rhomboid-like protein, mitochondrial [Crassostrea virginica]